MLTGVDARAMVARMTEPLTESGWLSRRDGRNMVIVLSGDWTARNDVSGARETDSLLDPSAIDAMRFDSTHLGRWDSSLLVFLSSLREASRRRHVVFDQTGLPPAARRLLAMLPAAPPAAGVRPRRAELLERFGSWAMARGADFVDFTTLIGVAILRVVPALRGKARMRAADLLTFVQDAGVAALPMVALVNLLVGGIVAFVGAIQLRRLGAEIYVSNLIGVTEVREMAPLITAIVMSGRTGSAYAAEIAAMQGSEEIAALRALGIPVFDYLILPRVSALSAMMPLLCIYAGTLGVLGGFAVAVSMMNISGPAFMAHLRAAVAGSDIFLGLAKSIAFGGWIAIASCRIGLNAGRSATDVGHAATTAAVSGIVGVIALDALFDVCANALGF
jgi:phospholipid/cholesterol/gamma-HCH transport system permease protein